MADPYAVWKALLAGEKPALVNEQPELGFWRKGNYIKEDGKAPKRVGWTPVAIFMNGAELTAVVGSATITDTDRLNELWTSVARYPISEEWFRAVSERGEPWPDSHEEKPAMVPEGQIGISPGQQALGMQERPESKILRELGECKKHLPKYATIDSDEMASKGRSLQNRYLDLRSDAKKHYDALNAPLLAEQKRIREIWFPLRDEAEEGSNTVRRALEGWEDEKRKAAKLAQEAAGKAARDHAEAARKAAAANQPAPPPPEQAKSNVPPPASQIRGGAGRAASVRVEKFITLTDPDAVYQQFRADSAIAELLAAIALRAVRAGVEVKGVTVEEKSVVR